MLSCVVLQLRHAVLCGVAAPSCCLVLCCTSVVCRRRYRSPTLEIAKSVQVPGKNEGTRVLSSRACVSMRMPHPRSHRTKKACVASLACPSEKRDSGCATASHRVSSTSVPATRSTRTRHTRRTRLAVLHAANAACRLAGLGAGCKALQKWCRDGLQWAEADYCWHGRRDCHVNIYAVTHVMCMLARNS